MKRFLFVLGLSAALFAISGCHDKTVEDSEAKQSAPVPDYSSRFVMACPRCGAPQRPYRINATKSYYRCTGLPPKFPFHSEETWSHTVNDHDGQEK